MPGLADSDLPRHAEVLRAFELAQTWSAMSIAELREDGLVRMLAAQAERTADAAEAIDRALHALAVLEERMTEVRLFELEPLPTNALGDRLRVARVRIARALSLPEPEVPAPEPETETVAPAPEPEPESRVPEPEPEPLPEHDAETVARALVPRLPPLLRALAAAALSLEMPSREPARGLRIFAGPQPLRGDARLVVDDDARLVIAGDMTLAALPHLAWTLPPQLRGTLLAELADPRHAGRPHRDAHLEVVVRWSPRGALDDVVAAALASATLVVRIGDDA